MQTARHYNRRYDKRQKRLQLLFRMRAAKERKRQERIATGWTPEPRMIPTTGLSWAVRDDLNGDTVWLPLKSARDTFRRVSVLLRHYQPGHV